MQSLLLSLALLAPEQAPFDFTQVIERARTLAQSPYVDPEPAASALLERIDYDAHGKITFRPDATLGKGTWPFPVQLFHPGRFFKRAIELYLVKEGRAEPLPFSKSAFTYKDKQLERAVPKDVGWAGFRFMELADGKSPRDWLVFLGASYFRSAGALDQYGLSARGIAVDTGLQEPEEFPRFRAFWLQESASPDAEWPVTVFALLDGPSLSGAYRFDIARRKDGVRMQVSAELFFRKAVQRLGIAPLTSMFWFAEADRMAAVDWRPEIHDSDGLALWTGSGEQLFRPLTNPPKLMTNSFADNQPRGFGLVQRDRNFSSYEDDGVFYEKRPSLWVEPRGDWGKGAVQLVEIPTDDEIYDNIVAYWLPEKLPQPGEKKSFAYTLHWVANEPLPNHVARVQHTRIGRGGAPGHPRRPGHMKFVVDFEGGPLEGLVQSDKVEPVVTLSRGKLTHKYALQVVGTKRWRGVFDVDVGTTKNDEPIDLRMYLRQSSGEKRTLSETWLYQYHVK